MEINVQEQNGISVCRIVGDIDVNSSPEVKQSFDNLIKEKKEKIVVNLKDVPYVDSSGLATLVEIFKNLRAYGGKMKLTNLSSQVMGLFEITKLNKLFDVEAEEADALNSF
ncbi:MAG: STAS domain-containing protein [Candidatus Omnitrophota bacterium]